MCPSFITYPCMCRSDAMVDRPEHRRIIALINLAVPFFEMEEAGPSEISARQVDWLRRLYTCGQ